LWVLSPLQSAGNTAANNLNSFCPPKNVFS
jgi:hypothetical protein